MIIDHCSQNHSHSHNTTVQLVIKLVTNFTLLNKMQTPAMSDDSIFSSIDLPGTHHTALGTSTAFVKPSWIGPGNWSSMTWSNWPNVFSLLKRRRRWSFSLFF